MKIGECLNKVSFTINIRYVSIISVLFCNHSVSLRKKKLFSIKFHIYNSVDEHIVRLRRKNENHGQFILFEV